jgi:superfamily II DNA or RNA helicase
MKPKANGSRLEETTALMQQAMATLLQNQTLFVARVEELKDQMDRKFTEVDRRLEHIEALLAKMFAELPEKVFGFGQAAAAKNQPG